MKIEKEDCPRCKEKALIISMFRTICEKCFYYPNKKVQQVEPYRDTTEENMPQTP